jgi:hypothetical protein
MIIKAPLGTYEAIAEVCTFHLGQQLVEEHDYMLIPGCFLDVEQAHVADKKQQQRAITDIEGALKSALTKFYALHPDIRQSIEWQIRDNLENDTPTTRFQTFFNDQGKDSPISSSDNFELHLRTALSSFLGLAADTTNLESSARKPELAAISAARNSMSDLNMKNMTKQARTGNTWQKALTVKRCRELWQLAKNSDAPKNSPSSPFGRFLGDIVDALGKRDDWESPQATMAAWQRCSEQNGWFI